jgi:hypothetical protein
MWGRLQRIIDGKRQLVYFVVSRSSQFDESGPDEIGYFVAVRDMTLDMIRLQVSEVATLLPPVRNRRTDYQWVCERYATAFAGRGIHVRVYRP